MELDKIRECKSIAEKAIETIIAEYEKQTGTHVHGVELNEDIVRVNYVSPFRCSNKYSRNIKLEVKL